MLEPLVGKMGIANFKGLGVERVHWGWRGEEVAPMVYNDTVSPMLRGADDCCSHWPMSTRPSRHAYCRYRW